MEITVNIIPNDTSEIKLPQYVVTMKDDDTDALASMFQKVIDILALPMVYGCDSH